MIEREVDNLLLGKSFLSVVLGLFKLEKNEKTLILDDYEYGYGELYTRYLTQVDVDFFKDWELRKKFPLLSIFIAI